MLTMPVKVLVLFTITWFAVLAAMSVFWFEPIAGGLKSPDAMVMGYDVAYMTQWVDFMGENGAASFLRWHTRFLDALFPLLLVATLIVVLRTILRQFARFAAMPPMAQLALPLLLTAPYGLFDYLENGLVARFLTGETPIDEASVGLASTYTVVKWSFVALNFLVIATFWYLAKFQQMRR